MAALLVTSPSLPPEATAFAALIDAQPAPATEREDQAFHYLLCLAMAERGALRLVDTHPGADGEVAVFESSAGETFTIPRPTIPPDVEARYLADLRQIVDDDE
jgi:hypothetical protein